MKQYQLLIQRRADLVAEAKAIFAAADAQGRDLTDVENERDDAIDAELGKMAGDIERLERLRANERMAAAIPLIDAGHFNAPSFNRLPRGDNFANGFAHWAATGDRSGLDASMLTPLEGGVEGVTIHAASNATDMNIGTAADGGNTVPVGFYNQIIARRDETMLAARLPIMRVPGNGTTVDVPLDSEADGEFVTTGEATDFDDDAPALGKKSLTLVKKTKFVDVSYELMDDTGVNLMAFLSDFVGRGMAKTHNDMLLTEVAANGTALKTFASATAIAFGEPEDIVGNGDLGGYLDEDNAIAWVMRSGTHWDIKSLIGDARQYGSQGGNARELLGYPVLYSQKAVAVAASAKPIYFGNWRYVGMREAPGLTFIRDPYTVAIKGQVRLLWHFRTVYGVLQPEAIGYGVHPSA